MFRFSVKVLLPLLLVFLSWVQAEPEVSTSTSATASASAKVIRPKCNKNEVFNNCKYSCPTDSCATLWASLPSFLCAADQKCSPGCVCAQGYLRNTTGVCVPQVRCLPLACENDPNAIRGCGDRCKKTCKDFKDSENKCLHTACDIDGCDCKDGFVYDENQDKCVMPEDCSPVTQCTGDNERFDGCSNANCGLNSCDDLGYPIICPYVSKCEAGCLCKEGYVRNKKGVCIPQNQCPSCGGDPNAVSGCGIYCGTKCEDRNRTGPIACPATCLLSGCDCRPNFYYDPQENRCVKPNECLVGLKCKDPNAEWVKCADNCATNHCPTNDTPPMCDSPHPCPPGCKCKINYKISKNGTCILAETCPPVECTRRNEVWASCPECLAEDCSNKDYAPSACKLLRNCQPQCVCKKNAFRNDEGICVPRNECPK